MQSMEFLFITAIEVFLAIAIAKMLLKVCTEWRSIAWSNKPWHQVLSLDLKQQTPRPAYPWTITLTKTASWASSKGHFHRNQKWRASWVQGPLFLENESGYLIYPDPILGKRIRKWKIARVPKWNWNYQMRLNLGFCSTIHSTVYLAKRGEAK